jgi:hypothetical protein
LDFDLEAELVSTFNKCFSRGNSWGSRLELRLQQEFIALASRVFVLIGC